MSEELQIIDAAPVESALAYISPVVSLERAMAQHAMLKQYVSNLLQEGHDFGQIPGTGSKPSLLKPGAEKLATIFGLTKRFALVQAVEDWDGSQHNGEPFFYYIYRCSLWKGDILIAESDGSCNSFESKYRYRKADRLCPICNQATIIKGRAEWGGGWLCYKNKGGCGEKYDDNDVAITSQEVGRVINPDIADQINTIQKMAQKRALIGTTLLAVNASEFFTQDIEDFEHQPPTGTEGGSGAQRVNPTTGNRPDPNPRKATPTGNIAQSVSELATPKQLGLIRNLAADLLVDEDAEATLWAKATPPFRVAELSRKGASAFIDHLKAIIAGTEEQLTSVQTVANVTNTPMASIKSVIPGVVVFPVEEEAPAVAHTRPTIVPSEPEAIPTAMGLEEFKLKLDEVKPKLPGWRYREIVQEFVMVESYQAGDEFDAIERDRGPMVQKLNDEAQFFVEKEKKQAEQAARKTSATFWKRVQETHVGHEFGMALFNKWTKDRVTDWTSAEAELERSVAGQMAA